MPVAALLHMPYSTSIGRVGLRQGSSHLGVEGIWSPCRMACGRRHDGLTAISLELGYMDCRELSMSTVDPN